MPVVAFDTFYARWLDDVKTRFVHFRAAVNNYVGSSAGPADEAEIAAMVRGFFSSYRDYMVEKEKLCKEDASFVLAGMRRSPLEAGFNWMGGWRPTAAIMLVYSLMGMHIENELQRLVEGFELPTLAALSAPQLSSLDSLQQKLRASEDRLCNRLALLQMLLADHHMTKAGVSSDFSIMQEAIEPKLASLSDFLIEAEELRGKTLEELLNILTPIQAAQYAVAAYDMAFAIQKLGIQRRGDSTIPSLMAADNIQIKSSGDDASHLQVCDSGTPPDAGIKLETLVNHGVTGNAIDYGDAQCVVKEGADMFPTDRTLFNQSSVQLIQNRVMKHKSGENLDGIDESIQSTSHKELDTRYQNNH